jgi:cyclophilin family peptidyl-prolyl cis-trans isomerase
MRCIIKTEKGDMFVELYVFDAPKTVENFSKMSAGER